MSTTKYTREVLEPIVKASYSISEVVRTLRGKVFGSTFAQVRMHIRRYQLNTDHFLGMHWNKGRSPSSRQGPQDILVLLTRDRRESAKRLRRALLEIGVPHQCQLCGMGPEWQGRPITLEIDHINGDWQDCRKENLRFLIPSACYCCLGTQTLSCSAFGHRTLLGS